MKLSTNTKLAISSYVVASVAFLAQQAAGMDIQTGVFGQFLQCPANEYMLEYCSSGENANCVYNGQHSWTVMGCGAYPKDAASSNSADVEADVNGWMCAAFGVLQECPQGYVMVGACGAGKEPDCTQYCGSPSYSAILCAPAPSSTASGPDGGTWSEPLGYGAVRTCPANQVMCGVCQSGGNEDCSGGAWRQRCCSIKPYGTKGSWQQIFSIGAPTDYTYKYGTTKSETFTQSSQWSDSVTASVSAGLDVEGVGSLTETLSSTMSEQFGSSDSQYWSMSEEQDETIHYNSTYNGMEVWQWVYDISDPYDNTLTTKSLSLATTPHANLPPKCLPGYQVADTHYQQCINTEGTLPGARRRSLRGQV